MKNGDSPDDKTLRQKAEDELKKKPASVTSHYTAAEVLNLMHELEVQQIELEIQNQELVNAQIAAQDAIDLYDFAPTGYFSLTDRGKIIRLNLSGAKMLGKDRSLLIGSRFDTFVSKDTKAAFNAFLKQVFESESKESCELMLLAEGNAPIYVHLSGITAQNGEICLVTAVDITTRKQADDLVQQIRQNYEVFFNTIDDFLFVLDQQGAIVHTNATVISRLGYSPEELYGKSVLMLHPDERREEAEQIVGKMLRGEIEVCPVPVVTKSGVQIPVETRISHGFWNGKPVLFGVTKDVSKIYFSEEKFSKIFHLNPSASGLTDLNDGTYIEVNEAFYTLLGFNKNEVIGKTAVELGILSPETIKEVLSKADQKGNTVNIEAVLKAKNGDKKFVMLSSELIYVQDKRYRYTVVHDFTERKNAEDELKESKLKYQFIVENTDDILWTMNPDFTFDYISPSVFKFLGYTVEEQQKQLLTDFLVPESAKLITDEFQIGMMHFQKKEFDKLRDRADLEVEFIRKDKSHGFAGITMIMVRDEQFNLIKIRGITSDITARKLAENALHTSKEYLDNIINAVGSPVFVKDHEHKFCLVNNALCTLLNLPRQELIGRTGREYFPDDQNEVFFLKDKEVFESGKENINEEFLTDGAGQIRTIVTSKTLYIDNSGNKFLVGVISDITERKHAEEELKRVKERIEKSEKELLIKIGEHERTIEILKQTNLELSQADLEITERKVSEKALFKKTEELALANEELNQFAYVASHDLQEPLRTISNFAGLLAQHKDIGTDKNISQYLGYILTATDKMQKLIKALLDFSRIGREAGFAPVDCNKVLKDVIAEMDVTISENNAKIIATYLPVIAANETEIRRLFMNLIGNAIKFHRPGIAPKIEISVIEKEEEYLFAFKDNGIGIEEQYREKIFIIFQRLHLADEYPGTGIGLATCNKIVAQHNGKIWADSKPGEGSTFYFSISRKLLE